MNTNFVNFLNNTSRISLISAAFLGMMAEGPVSAAKNAVRPNKEEVSDSKTFTSKQPLPSETDASEVSATRDKGMEEETNLAEGADSNAEVYNCFLQGFGDLSNQAKERLMGIVRPVNVEILTDELIDKLTLVMGQTAKLPRLDDSNEEDLRTSLSRVWGENPNLLEDMKELHRQLNENIISMKVEPETNEGSIIILKKKPYTIRVRGKKEGVLKLLNIYVKFSKESIAAMQKFQEILEGTRTDETNPTSLLEALRGFAIPPDVRVYSQMGKIVNALLEQRNALFTSLNEIIFRPAEALIKPDISLGMPVYQKLDFLNMVFRVATVLETNGYAPEIITDKLIEVCTTVCQVTPDMRLAYSHIILFMLQKLSNETCLKSKENLTAINLNPVLQEFQELVASFTSLTENIRLGNKLTALHQLFAACQKVGDTGLKALNKSVADFPRFTKGKEKESIKLFILQLTEYPNFVQKIGYQRPVPESRAQRNEIINIEAASFATQEQAKREAAEFKRKSQEMAEELEKKRIEEASAASATTTATTTTTPSNTEVAAEDGLGEIRAELQGQLPAGWTAHGYLEQNSGLKNLFPRVRPNGWTDADVLANHYIKWGQKGGWQYKTEEDGLGEVSKAHKAQLPAGWTAQGYLEQNSGLKNLFPRVRPNGWTDADVLANHYIKWGQKGGWQYKTEEDGLGEVRAELQGQLPAGWTAQGYLEHNSHLKNLFRRPRPDGWTNADVLAHHFINWGQKSGLNYLS